ncbi:BAI1-associated protein 3 isoform X2 [Parasteatoda tepidariorum]|uniref:BAI1-associated protein 3 isoform X2 n=1 Tax=Parasteatoda tepidariorum TaxID=114398 RepID=UPI001C71D6BE|nr:BAI1-associated protein 3-like isoform X2 [Parasteatoda tepidariorum]
MDESSDREDGDSVFEEDELQKDKPPPSECDSGIEVAPYKIGRKEWEELYIAVLYTIKHKLGANSSGYSVYAEDLYEYAQEAFCMSDNDHKRFLSIAQDEKPPILVVNVTVVEAQGLEAKDPNGFSDPYCMLGIQPANTLERRNSSDDEFGTGSIKGSPRRQGGLKKLGASLKRKDRIRSNSISETLPAKFIRTTSVKPQTLNPRWNEQFRLDIEDIRTDRLHLDIWDHDDESSVFDAARKLNEVSSLKGLGRYFKQIAQSARTSTGENIDDFLGCVNIRCEDIPSSGLDRWFCLEGRTERSSVQGQIRLKISLSTREDKDSAGEDDNWKEVVEHQELLWVFIQHELKQHFGPSYEWAGDLPQPALTILHQHAIQGDITELQQTLCRWTMYSKQHMEVPLDYALLYQLLDDLSKAWGEQENPLSRDEEASLAESFNIFLDFSLKLMQKHRDLFPPGNTLAQHKLTHLLKCLSTLHNLKAFRWCCPFRHDLHVEIITSIRKGTLDWFNVQVANAEALQRKESTSKWPLKRLIDLINVLNTDVYKGYVYYNEEFESIAGVSYSIVVYKQLEKMVGDIIGCKIQDACSTVDAEPDDKIDSDYMVQTTAMFELYMALQEFIKFKDNIPSDERKNLTLVNYHLWFKDAVNHWFVVASTKSLIRIKKAVELDKIAFIDNYVKHSTSAVDTATCFVQIKEFWRQLSWPDPAGSFTFVMKVIEIICEGTIYYAKLCQQRLQKTTETEGQTESNEKLCITINNMEYVLQTLRPLEEELGVEQIIKALNVNQGGCTANQCRESIYDLINKTEDDVTGKIFNIICGMVEKLRPDMKKFVFHLAWAPEKLDAENAIRPLLENLDTTLRALYNNLLQANFDRLLDMMWTVLMHELMETTQSNIGKEKLAFFDRLHSSLAILVDFFHGSGKGLPLDCIQNAPYQDLFHMLKLQKSETLHLIELYILQRLEEQQKVEKPTYGILTIKTSYNAGAESLYIDILNARDLLPLDPTGFSDPFVIIELVPRHFFPNCVKQRTKVQKKTLFPLFDEAFEFRIPYELLHREGAGLCFSVMDHDMVTKNDFEGEAFLPLCNITESSPEEMKDMRPTELCLIHPNDKNEILVALAARTWDKDAQDFVKNLKHRRHKKKCAVCYPKS